MVCYRQGNLEGLGMTVTTGPRRGRAPRDETPRGARALSSAVIWLAVAVGAALASVEVAIHVPSIVVRIIAAPLLGLIGVLALMLASESTERCLTGRYRAWRRRLYWFSVSLVALAVVVVLGAPLSVLIGDGTGFWVVAGSMAADVVVGMIAGALAVAIIQAFGAVLGGTIFRAHSRLGRHKGADPWRPPHTTETWRWGHVWRGAWLGAGGLVMSALCTAVITTVTTNHSGGADSPTTVAHGFLTVVLPLLCWFVGTGIGWVAFKLWRGRRRKTIDVEPHPRLRHGTHATALGVCLIVLWVWLAAGSLQTSTAHHLWSGRLDQHLPTVSVTEQQWRPESPYVAEQFEPRFWLTNDESWSPTSVSWYLQQAGTADTGPAACGSHGCYEIRKPGCDVAQLPAGCAPGGAADPALYYAYFPRSDSGLKTEAASASWRLIEYWIFYNYDSLDAGAVTQWHQSDWEQVSVLVQRSGASMRPREVAFSEHCYGAVLPAARVRWDGSHPKVYVGKGSHANYPRPVSVPVRQLRCSLGLEPRYVGVAGLFFAPAFDGASIELPLMYVLGLRDRTDKTRPTPPLPLVSMADTPGINGFKGHWGLDNNISFIGLPRVTTGAGPGAPQTQDPWKNPVCTMLLSRKWLSPGRVTEPGWVCK